MIIDYIGTEDPGTKYGPFSKWLNSTDGILRIRDPKNMKWNVFLELGENNLGYALDQSSVLHGPVTTSGILQKQSIEAAEASLGNQEIATIKEFVDMKKQIYDLIDKKINEITIKNTVSSVFGDEICFSLTKVTDKQYPIYEEIDIYNELFDPLSLSLSPTNLSIFRYGIIKPEGPLMQKLKSNKYLSLFPDQILQGIAPTGGFLDFRNTKIRFHVSEPIDLPRFVSDDSEPKAESVKALCFPTSIMTHWLHGNQNCWPIMFEGKIRVVVFETRDVIVGNKDINVLQMAVR